MKDLSQKPKAGPFRAPQKQGRISAEVMYHQWDQINDKVFQKMFDLVILDPVTGQWAYTKPPSICQGLHLVMNMIIWVLQHCLLVKDKVSHPGCILLDKADRMALG